MKKLIVILLFFAVSCGYKPIYSKNDQLDLEFSKIILNGDEKINRQIINIINFKENLSSNYELLLETTFNTEETSKNLKGEVKTYRSIIKTQLVIKKDEKVFKNKNFLNEFSYNNKDNKYELTKYQNEIKNSLINDLSGEIILFLKLL
tara:strand:+ start:10589 stop:11032 length:444 start_codon:yes stop_codon:yes gene_type:complete